MKYDLVAFCVHLILTLSISGCQSLREPLRRKRSTRLPRICKRDFVSVKSNVSQNSSSWLSIRAGFSGGFIDRIVETKGVRLLQSALREFPSHSHHIHFSLTLLTKRRPNTMVSISIPVFLIDREELKKNLAKQQLSEASANDYAEY